MKPDQTAPKGTYCLQYKLSKYIKLQRVEDNCRGCQEGLIPVLCSQAAKNTTTYCTW